MKIGKYEVYLLNLGNYFVDGGSVFGVIPKVVWEKNYLSDERNRIKLVMKSPLLISNNRVILIDTGSGNKYSEKIRKNYNLPNSYDILLEELKRYSITPDDVTDVILTHLHFDHCGGNTYYDNERILKISFPNAKYYVQKAQLEWALNPSIKDKASYISSNYDPLIEEQKIILINGDLDFDDNISLYKLNGHTYGLQLVGIYDDNIKLLFTSDLTPLSDHVNLTYISSYDLLPLITLEEKKLFLEECYLNDVYLLLEHDEKDDLIKIDKNEKGYFIKERLKWNEFNGKN